MSKDLFLPFQGKRCKLVFKNGLILYGMVDAVGDEQLVFTTRQKSSILPFSEISELKELTA
jgi:hypothetical protein